MFSIQEVIQITAGSALQLACPTDMIQQLLIDSRKVVFTETSLFFAIAGERHDGHLFINELIKKGVRNFIITNLLYIPTYEKEAGKLNINVILVPNAIDALQKVAEAHRAKFSYPVIGITGSNGKTIVKEWLYQLLSPDFRIVRSPKSYNSQVGVPLSVWEMNENHNLAIFEAGISRVGEMQNLQRIIQPTLGIFTNIGSAHDEGFENTVQKIREKALLFKHCPSYTTHKVLLNNIEMNSIQNFTVLNTTQTNTGETIFDLAYQHEIFQLKLPSIDKAMLENMLTCLCILLHFNIPFATMQTRFNTLRPVAMRLEMKEAIHDSYVIDDSYNNDLSGLQMALSFLKSQQQASQKVVILSDMYETNLPDAELYQIIATMLHGASIQILVGIGKKIKLLEDFLKINKKINTHFFEDTATFLASPFVHSFHHSLVLVKGSRAFAFEKIVKKLQKKTHGTVLEINLDALTHNLNFYRSLLKPATKVMVMVKAFAYGSGSAEVAQWLQFHRVDYLGVAYVDEGVFLRKNGITLPIMVLNPTADSFGVCATYNLEPEIYSFKILEELLSFFYAQETHFPNFKIHIKLDTGMRRLGFEAHEIAKLGKMLVDRLPHEVRVASVLSHMAGADEAQHQNFSQHQIAVFRQATLDLEEILGHTFLRHIANSPAIARYPEAHFDMVRLGVGLYGVETTGLYSKELATVATFKTIISQIKHIKAGESVGYGRQGVASTDMTIATIAVGYADGFLRRLSKGVGKVAINGQLAYVMGNVCMDMTMVDITHIEANEGDEATIFGENPTVFDIAEALGTIPYEVLTLVSERVKRVFFTE